MAMSRGPALKLTATTMLVALLRVAYPYRRAREVEDRSQLVEGMSERLAVVFGAHSSPLGVENKSGSEDEDNASFENLVLSAVEIS